MPRALKKAAVKRTFTLYPFPFPLSFRPALGELTAPV
jgi:hypothetical protein